MIDIEKELDECVKAIGGNRVTDIIGDAPSFPNADYLFYNYNVIAELKCLDEDKIKDKRLSKKASDIYERYLNSGKVPVVVFGTQTISTEGFSEEFAREIAELYRAPLHETIKKANRQIRETKHKLMMDKFHGLLILANNKHSALHPALAMWLLNDTFRRYSFESINSVLYFTANLKAEHPEIDKDLLVWIPSHRDPRNKCPDGLLNQLQSVWFKRVGDIIGENIHTIFVNDTDTIHDYKNKPLA